MWGTRSDVTWRLWNVHDKFEMANRRGEHMRAAVPKAIAARYDRATGRVVIHLSSRLDVSFSPQMRRDWKTPSRRSWRILRSVLPGWAFTFPSWMRTCICQACQRDFLGQGDGWRRGWAELAASRGVRPSGPLPK